MYMCTQVHVSTERTLNVLDACTWQMPVVCLSSEEQYTVDVHVCMCGWECYSNSQD